MCNNILVKKVRVPTLCGPKNCPTFPRFMYVWYKLLMEIVYLAICWQASPPGPKLTNVPRLNCCSSIESHYWAAQAGTNSLLTAYPFFAYLLFSVHLGVQRTREKCIDTPGDEGMHPDAEAWCQLLVKCIGWWLSTLRSFAPFPSGTVLDGTCFTLPYLSAHDGPCLLTCEVVFLKVEMLLSGFSSKLIKK